MNTQVLWYVLGPPVLLLYYLVAVRFVRKKRPGAVVTQYEPPAGVSPAMMRYVFSGQLDEKAVAATLVRLAALGLIRFHGLDRYYSVVRTNAPLPVDLAADEIALYRFMFNLGDAEPKPFPGRLRTYQELPHDAYLLAPSDDPSFVALLNTLRSALIPVGDTEYFTDNLRYILPAASLSFALSFTKQAPAVALVIGVAFACCLFLVRHPEQLFGVPVTSASDGFYNIRIFFLFMFIAMLLPLSNGSVLAVLSLTVVLVLNFYFIPQLRDRTSRGFQLLAQLQGYRQFLQNVELDRMQRLKTPEFAPNAATDYLASAIALDIEHAWGDYVEHSGCWVTLPNAARTSPRAGCGQKVRIWAPNLTFDAWLWFGLALVVLVAAEVSLSYLISAPKDFGPPEATLAYLAVAFLVLFIVLAIRTKRDD